MKSKKKTPSQLPFPVIVMCAPTYADTKILNNVWMADLGKEKAKLDIDKFMGQWYNLYELLSANALIYLLPPKQGLQDQTYVNSFVYLPHVGGENTIVLSNFKAPGRVGEEKIAGKFLKDLGYKVHECPYKFEGFPELKYSGKDNIYYGGYGLRSDIKALNWVEKTFDAKIIKLCEVDPYLYHLDCSLFVANADNVVVCDEVYTKKELRAIEKVAEIHPVTVDSAYQGITNSLKVDTFVLNASSLDYMKSTDKYYREEVNKNKELEEICERLSLELIYVDLSQAMISGALLSCFCTPLNHRNMIY